MNRRRGLRKGKRCGNHEKTDHWNKTKVIKINQKKKNMKSVYCSSFWLSRVASPLPQFDCITRTILRICRLLPRYSQLFARETDKYRRLWANNKFVEFDKSIASRQRSLNEWTAHRWVNCAIQRSKRAALTENLYYLIQWAAFRRYEQVRRSASASTRSIDDGLSMTFCGRRRRPRNWDDSDA